ncbi:MAG TPA: type II toxin-antitoxin system VapC family toxin [Gemmatimonadaceae bacterium]|nr:type II toxin-antitoxin system VapC family toxin [Gemmatimonadaceae bacterium]
MKLLLDTKVVLWWQGDLGKLAERARVTIRAADEVYISAASAWEAEIKRSLGKLAFPQSFGDILVFNNFKELPVTLAHAAASAALPHHHRDPFDRMLIAQASVEGCTLVTADRKLAVYGVALILA